MKYKGNKLTVLVLLAVIVGVVGLMYIFSGGILTSWSIADTTKFRWVLGIVLGAIVALWTLFSFKHNKREFVLLDHWKLPKFSIKKPFITWSKKDIKYRHAFQYCALFFIGVLIFGLGGGTFMKVMHYIFTILGSFTMFLIVVRSTTGLQRTLYAVGLFSTILVWCLGFLNIAFSVYFGEFLFTIPVTIWVLNELKNITD
jgi:hypothetical protein